MAESGVPWTTLRATQFHDLSLMTVRQMAKLPVVPVPSGFRFQPVDTGEVADAARRARARRAGRAGARHRRAARRTRWATWSAATCGRPQAPRDRAGAASPARPPRAFRAGANLAPERAVGRRTWEDFLAERVS